MTFEDVQAALGRLDGIAQRTPLSHSSTFSRMSGAEVWLKCENLQRTGSFKLRGAYNRLAQLSPAERKRGVIAASAGNHAQGVALAAQLLGIQATVFMPQSTPLAKVAATQSYGADIRLEGGSYDEACDAALRFQKHSQATFVHPYDDRAVMAGQGTIACEILEDLGDVDAVVVPVGGGGLVCGIAVAAKALRPGIQVIGVRVAQAGAGTIADGINVREPLASAAQLADDIVAVEEEDISHAVVLLLERSKLVVEGAGAVGLAALLSRRVSLNGRRAAVVLSGGNIDVNLMARIIEHGLATSGRYLIFETWLQDRPGELLKVLQILLDERVNILSVEHRRPASFPEVEVMLTVETRDFAHGERLLDRLRERGYRVNRLEVGATSAASDPSHG
jgi:threonine dehydratase